MQSIVVKHNNKGSKGKGQNWRDTLVFWGIFSWAPIFAEKMELGPIAMSQILTAIVSPDLGDQQKGHNFHQLLSNLRSNKINGLHLSTLTVTYSPSYKTVIVPGLNFRSLNSIWNKLKSTKINLVSYEKATLLKVAIFSAKIF